MGAPRASVRAVEVDDGSVLVDEEQGGMLPLNPTATLIWQCFDGSSTLAEICTDLAEGLGAPYEAVLHDTTAVTVGLVARGLLADTRAPSPAPAPTPAPRPAGPAASLADASYARSFTVGDRVVRIRGNDEATLALLTDALAVDALAVDARAVDAGAPADLTLVVGEPRGQVEPLHLLYRADELVFRAVDRGRLLRAALAHVDALLPSPAGTTRLHAHVLVGTAGALVVGGAFLEVLELAGARLARSGWRLVDTGGPLIDHDSFDLVVATVAPRDDAGAATIDRHFPRAREEVRHPKARYPVRAVVVVGSVPDADRLETSAQRLAALAPLVRWPDHWPNRRVATADLALVRDLAAGRPVHWLAGVDDQELLEVVPALLARR
ncbi:MAG TPA: PqqD family protein [Acidimicrobiia bacterium]